MRLVKLKNYHFKAKFTKHRNKSLVYEIEMDDAIVRGTNLSI